MSKASDPRAAFGCTNHGKDWFFGYKSIILATSEPLIIPLAWQVIPVNQQGQRIKRQKFYKSKLGQSLYQRRKNIERLNNHLKDLFLIDPFTVKRLRNANTYLNLVILLYLAGVYHNYSHHIPRMDFL